MTRNKDKTESRRRLVIPKRLSVLVISVSLLLVPIVLYFTLYISSRTNYLTNRDFRQLASVSSQLEDRIDNLKQLFFRAVTQSILDQTPESKNASRSRILNALPEQNKPMSLK